MATSWWQRLLGRRKDTENAAAMGAGAGGAWAAAPEAAATNSLMDGMAAVRAAARNLAKVDPAISQGNLFEYIEAARFNADAARKGSDLVAKVTAAMGENTAPDDLRIMRGDEVVRRVQAKSFAVNTDKDAARLTYEVSDPKYHTMQKVTNPENVDRVRDLAERRAEMQGSLKAEDYRDTARNVSGETRHGEVRSGGTSYQEARLAAEHLDRFAAWQEAQQVARETATQAGAAAATGAVIGGAISAIRNSLAVSRGEMSANEAARATLADAGRAAVRGGATGAGGALIRSGAEKAGISALAKGNVATAVSAMVIETGVSVYRFARGEISGEQLAEHLGQSGTSTLSSMYAGAAAGAVFGPGGAVVGSMTGYLVASSVYQSAMAILRSARLAQAEADRVEALCREAVAEMHRQRAEFERLVEQRLQARRQEFAACFALVDAGMRSGEPSRAVAGLSDLAAMFGQKLQFASFEEFDQFMKRSDEPLRF